ncbi:hypothetical protein BpHYR1_048473, partial [Brachionus plicatilis]
HAYEIRIIKRKAPTVVEVTDTLAVFSDHEPLYSSTIGLRNTCYGNERNEIVNYWKNDSKCFCLELLTKALTYSLIKSIVIYLNELLCYQALCHLGNLSEYPMEYHEEDYNCT